METKVCPRCGETKPRSEFHLKRRAKDGLQPFCKKCQVGLMRSLQGKANALRVSHGLDYDASWRWARILSHPYNRDAITGVPLHVITRRNTWLRGGEVRNRRLSLDHIVPGNMNAGLRPLEYSANVIRRDAAVHDVALHREMSRWWTWYGKRQRPYWLTDTPGYGGRYFKTPRVEAQLRRLRPDLFTIEAGWLGVLDDDSRQYLYRHWQHLSTFKMILADPDSVRREKMLGRERRFA